MCCLLWAGTAAVPFEIHLHVKRLSFILCNKTTLLEHLMLNKYFYLQEHV